MYPTLYRRTNGWHDDCDNQPLENGVPYRLDGQRTFMLSTTAFAPDHHITTLTVSGEGSLRFTCEISPALEVSILRLGAVELAMHNAAHYRLAEIATTALWRHHEGRLLVGVKMLPTMTGFSYPLSTRVEHLTDSQTTNFNYGQGAVVARCSGGTYLVRAYHRRGSQRPLYAVEVTVAPGYNRAALETCLKVLR